MIITSLSSREDAGKFGGGKGFGLYLLTVNGLSVPEWIILGEDIFFEFIVAAGLKEITIADLASITLENLSVVSQALQKRIRTAIMPDKLRNKINKAVKTLGECPLAVRSSGCLEDSQGASFAGLHKSFLFVSSDSDIEAFIQSCWASAFSERALHYRLQKNLSLILEAMGMAVVIQRCIDGAASGIAFTVDPIGNDDSKVIINASYGLGAELAAGGAEYDSYVFCKRKEKLLERRVAEKKTALVKGEYQGIKRIDVSSKDRNKPCLQESEVKQVANEALKIEKLFGMPQDIEWTLANGKLYILQSRSVSSSSKLRADLMVWDNSNISESYGGVTLPLTFTFARYVYYQVYLQFCEVLLIPRRERIRMEPFLQNMLGSFYGRVYYNMLNWYRLVSLLPGFTFNRSFMETMMGTNFSLQRDFTHQIEPLSARKPLISRGIRLLSGYKFLHYHLFIDLYIARFLKYFDQVYQQYRSTDYTKLNPSQGKKLYDELERLLLQKWKAPIINDFLCMVHFGIFKKISKKWIPTADQALVTDLLVGEKLQSIEPVEMIAQIAKEISDRHELNLLLTHGTSEQFMNSIQSNRNYKHIEMLLRQYVDLYGFRCENEMKLEQKDLHQDLLPLVKMLRLHVLNEVIKKGGQSAHKRRKDAERKVKKSLSWHKKIFFFWSLRNTRKALKNRENTRICRSQIYGIVRKLFFGIGEWYAEKRIIEASEDIFYLELHELFGMVNGTLTIVDVKSLIALRKKEYESYSAKVIPSRFTTYGPVYWDNAFTIGQESVLNDFSGSMKTLYGTGCSAGIVEGKAVCISSPQQWKPGDGNILVAQRTDPGWTPIFSATAAVLVEKGSMLSHSAIIARELGIPAVVGIPNLTERIKTGMLLRVDGSTGIIQMLSNE